MKMEMENMIDYDLTMHGIYKMYCNLFQKFGWMILLKSKSNKNNIIYLNTYIKCLKNLHKNIDKKEKSIKNDKDKKDDCKIMIKNLEVLIKHAEKDFKMKEMPHNLPNNNKNMTEYDSTMYGLHKWFESVFEKLGWMVIACEYKDKERLKEYYTCILKLYKSIDLKEKKSNNIDRKEDYKIMKNDLIILLNHVKADFM